MSEKNETQLELDTRQWNSVNDGVMGGVSDGEMVATKSGLRFQGALSLKNNGGFASVRRPIDDGLEDGYIKLKVRGDGRKYQLRLRQDNNWDGIAYRHEFDTSGEWEEISFKLEDFEPVFRGRKLDTGPVVPARVRQLGILLADGKQQQFRLDIKEISFFNDPTES